MLRFSSLRPYLRVVHRPTVSDFKRWLRAVGAFLRRHWIGTVVIVIATLIFFWPIVTRIASYSEGGDAMFNAWTLARDQHCVLLQGCPHYADGNIYFPNKDSMFYSETQLSAGLLTLPLYFINQNPVFTYNVWTILSFFFAGWFMYLLAKRLSKGNELVAVFAGLAFELAPARMSAVTHLQSLSIFYLPLAVLLIVKFLDTARKKYLAWLFVVLALLFYASWYEMVFALIGISVLLLVLRIGKVTSWKQTGLLVASIGAAAIVTLPLAMQYVAFSKSQNATFTLGQQANLSSSLYDYTLPHSGTLLGKWYYKANPGVQMNTYNLDGFSYDGISLYITAGLLLVAGYVLYRRTRAKRTSQAREYKRNYVYVAAFVAMAFVGFVVSLGPALKLKYVYLYTEGSAHIPLAIPMPWLAVDYFFPQFHFIRAIDRATVIALFGLCCTFAFLPVYVMPLKWRRSLRYGIIGLVCACIVFELLPVHRVPMSPVAASYSMRIPAVYKLVKSDPSIDNIIVLRSDLDYPGAQIPVARTEDVLWAGYHNKNIFNGYSGYTPPQYFAQLADFTDLKPDDVPKMQKLGLRYVIIDKQLSRTGSLVAESRVLFSHKIYEDSRYILYKL